MTESGPSKLVGRRSFAELIGDVPRLLGELVRAEIDSLKQELARSARRAGVGLGLVVGAFVILLIAIVVLVIAAISALALVLPAWAAALIVAGALIVIAVLVGWIGIARLRTAAPDFEEHIDSINDDIRAIKGEAPRVPAEGDPHG